MPIISPFTAHPLSDGRQSQRAMVIRRGVQRLFSQNGIAAMPELQLPGGRRADLTAMTPKGEIWIIEIKSSIEDFRVDRKWHEYREFCDRLYFASHPEVPQEIFPADAGFILSDGYGAEMLREAPEHRLAAPARKAMTLRFARNAALRLMAAEMAGIEIEPAQADEL